MSGFRGGKIPPGTSMFDAPDHLGYYENLADWINDLIRPAQESLTRQILEAEEAGLEPVPGSLKLEQLPDGDGNTCRFRYTMEMRKKT